jgi:hypothetical protein
MAAIQAALTHEGARQVTTELAWESEIILLRIGDKALKFVHCEESDRKARRNKES